MEFKELSEWIMDEHCSFRMIKDGDVNKIEDRIAFIEKTPRVKLLKGKYAVEEQDSWTAISSKHNAWVSGPKGCGQECGRYQPSRDWCDQMLRLLGWE